VFHPDRIRRALGLGVSLAVLGALSSGCSSTKGVAKGANNGKVFAVTADKTSFFRYGPQQGNGPDESLPKDTLMTLIRPSFGYCKVQLMPSAQTGYVASEDIRPAPPTLLAALNAPIQASNSSSERENFDVRSTDPNFVPPPEALPDPDLPPTAAEPSPQP
jgi:hypothetical protein